MSNVVCEGDLNSDAKGSAARMNAGKLPVELVPLRAWQMTWVRLDGYSPELQALINSLRAWQEGDDTALLEAWAYFPQVWMDEVVRVLDFGQKKYAAWNWAKGQRWGCTLGSLIRHIRCIVEKNEALDSDSGLNHWGHIGCNLIFLVWFQTHYKEGDDRPPVYDNDL